MTDQQTVDQQEPGEFDFERDYNSRLPLDSPSRFGYRIQVNYEMMQRVYQHPDGVCVSVFDPLGKELKQFTSSLWWYKRALHWALGNKGMVGVTTDVYGHKKNIDEFLEAMGNDRLPGPKETE
jgi:hypothetical protein